MGTQYGFSIRRLIDISVLLTFCSLYLLVEPSCCHQSYDKTSCYSAAQLPGSNYLCNLQKSSCDTFVVYRVQKESQTLASIASLMSANLTDVCRLNNLTESDALLPGEEIIIPVACTCLERYSIAKLVYNYTSASEMLPDVACRVFEALVKAQVLMDENQDPAPGRNVQVNVPLRCACPDLPDVSARAGPKRYLVTYPVLLRDSLALIATKFNVTVQDIAEANGLGMDATIFGQTTLLIPANGLPAVDRGVREPSPSPVASTFPLDNIVKGPNSDARKHYALLGCGLLAAIVCICLSFFSFLLIRARYRNKLQSFEPLSDKAARLSNFSPNFITGMSELKHSLINFTPEEIREATKNFSEANVLGSSVFVGRTSRAKYAMQQVESDEAARHVVYILTRINHLNVVKLMGYCYEKPSYLVFEYVENGSLRDCLSNKKLAQQLTWTRRMQIAFDLAAGLHYLHYSTKPSYIHHNINSWFRLAKPVMKMDDKVQPNINQSRIVGRQGYLAPEYLTSGSASSKVDVYAFGVVLLELLSAEEAVSKGRFLKDSVRFLAEGSVQDTLNSSSDKLKEFIDPALEGEFTLGTAVCIALLAKCCVADDPQLRPNMNDILKTLSRAV
uniref:Uncharacterized protein n=1 Tax=Kalanchoe fedtschenkoi TaxID=63787 RepID=A0A7N1A6U8_KALFE